MSDVSPTRSEITDQKLALTEPRRLSRVSSRMQLLTLSADAGRPIQDPYSRPHRGQASQGYLRCGELLGPSSRTQLIFPATRSLGPVCPAHARRCDQQGSRDQLSPGRSGSCDPQSHIRAAPRACGAAPLPHRQRRTTPGKPVPCQCSEHPLYLWLTFQAVSRNAHEVSTIIFDKDTDISDKPNKLGAYVIVSDLDVQQTRNVS